MTTITIPTAIVTLAMPILVAQKAHKAELSVDDLDVALGAPGAASEILRGRRPMNINEVFRFAEIFGTSPVDLCREAEELAESLIA